MATRLKSVDPLQLREHCFVLSYNTRYLTLFLLHTATSSSIEEEMNDGNTLMENALVGSGMDAKANQDDSYDAVEDAAMEEAEDVLMDGDITSEEECKVERQMLTAALVNSVAESTSKTADDSKQRYSLRKRRRSSAGDPSSSTESSPAKAKMAIASPINPAAPPPATIPHPPSAVAVPKAPVVRPPIRAVSSPPPAKAPPPKLQAPALSKAVSSPIPRMKTEAVPAVTVAAPATPLPAPLQTIPLQIPASTLLMPSTLPPALQPPLRPKPPMPVKAASSAPISKPARPKTSAKPQRLAPAVRVQSPAKPLTPNPGLGGVPNPLSIPLPKSKSILVTKQKKSAHPGAPPAAAFTAKTTRLLTVPCPLPPSSFDSNTELLNSEAMPPPPAMSMSMPMPVHEPFYEKKKVTMAPEPDTSRGRIFSIDLDPASLDFSVLDSGESGTPAPASADLPLVTDCNSRDRAFSFECFAFGISADEALPPLSEHNALMSMGGEARPHEMLALPRPRGDSIIFDPVSFQEGGIHEEHALTTRETRCLSIDLDAVIMSSSVPGPPPSSRDLQQHPGAHYSTSKYAPAPVPVTSSALPGSRQAPPKSHYRPPVHHYPDGAPSNARVGAPPPHRPPPHHHAHQTHYARPPQGHSHMVPSAALSHDMHSNGAVAIIGSCATSTTLQMELLNKDGRIGIYLPEARKERIARFHAKRKMRIWRKRIKYDCRKKLADSRPRIKGRFVKRTDMD